MNKIVFICILISVTGCASYIDYYKLDADYLQRRQLETRYFETSDENAMITASAQVLQDLGFTLEESEAELGLITASKDREASSMASKIGIILLAAFAGTSPVYDVSQRIYVTLVVSESRNNEGYNVRIEFARIIVNNQGGTRVERITDEETYKGFFDKLSQSVFLTANYL